MVSKIKNKVSSGSGLPVLKCVTDDNGKDFVDIIDLQKIKSDWKYVTDKEIENIVNIMIEEIYPKKKEDYCLGSNLGWIVSVEKTLYNNGINKITELNEKNKIKCCMD